MTDELLMMTMESICDCIHKKSTPTFIEQLLAESIDLIKRQQTEIERLTEEYKKLKHEMSYMSNPYTIGDRHEMGG